MISKRFITIVFILTILFDLEVQSQNYSFEKMTNAFVLELHEKGFAEGLEIISYCRDQDTLSMTFHELANRKLELAFSERDNDILAGLKTAHTLYKRSIESAPQSPWAEISQNQIEIIRFFFAAFNRSLEDQFYTKIELKFTSQIIDFTKLFAEISEPNPLSIINQGEFQLDPLKTVSKYFDEIVINYPKFAPYAYYYKVLFLLDLTSKVDIVTYTIKGQNQSLLTGSPEYLETMKDVNEIMRLMDDQYPTHDKTLDLHLIIAKAFIESKRSKINYSTFEHLSYVVQNDPKKMGIRYLIAKEFLQSNQFQDQ